MAQNSTQPTWNAAALATQLGKIAEQSQRLVQDFLRDRPDIAQLGMGDVTTLPSAFIELATKMMTDPAAIARTQIDLFNDSLRVWQTAAERLMGHGAGNEEPTKDKRFKHPAWTESGVFNFVKESYLIWAKAVLAAVHGVEGLELGDRTQSRLLYAPVRRRALPVQFHRNQSRGPRCDARDWRTEPSARPREPARGFAARQRSAVNHYDRHGGVPPR